MGGTHGNSRNGNHVKQAHGAQRPLCEVALGKESSKRSKDRVVLQKYSMHMSSDDSLGEGTSSICRKGTDLQTRRRVAIKVYKNRKGDENNGDVKLTKFRRQIAVLQELQQPFEDVDPAYCHEQLMDLEPHRLFLQLLDYSQDKSGQAGPDLEDGVMYVVTELGQFSLKDFLKFRKEEGRPLSREMVHSVTKAIVLTVAGLHAKGLIHLDLKPENLMFFNGCLKLIDVDGCVKRGTSVSITDASLSFSPCYCAPEWAQFLIEDSDEPRIVVTPALDVWSVGMSICELVTLDAVLKPTYASFLRHGRSHREAGFLFVEWLSSIKKPPMPQKITQFDQDLVDLLSSWLLQCAASNRKTLAQCLDCPYLVSTPEHETNNRSNELSRDKVKRLTIVRNRSEDHSQKAVHMGTLWKLNVGGNAKDPSHWLKRDMWIANNGSFCYFSLKENKRLVLRDAHQLSSAEITDYEQDSCKAHAFQIKTKAERDDGTFDTAVFATETDEERITWVRQIEHASILAMLTMHLGAKMAQEFRSLKLTVKNRRIKADSASQDGATYKAKLWKVKAEGDRMKEEDWYEREMWLSKNGCLVYWSMKEERDLIYYTQDDIMNATIRRVTNDNTVRPWAFQVILPTTDGVEFVPGEFAAETEEARERWITEFLKFTDSA